MAKLNKQALALAAAMGGFLLAAQPVDAQVPFNSRATAISAGDQSVIQQVTFRLLEQRKAGVSETWTGKRTSRKIKEASASSGTIKILRVYQDASRPCAEVENIFTLGAATPGSTPRHYVLEYCRLSTGLWRIAG
jgi:hypothetical protein